VDELCVIARSVLKMFTYSTQKSQEMVTSLEYDTIRTGCSIVYEIL